MVTKVYEFIAQAPQAVLSVGHGELVVCSLGWITVVGILAFWIIKSSRK